MSDTVREMILLVVGTFLIVGACMLTRIPYIIANHRDDLKAEAVKRGFAEWVSDYNGNTAFKWKEGVK
jgi:hypothetical protein